MLALLVTVDQYHFNDINFLINECKVSMNTGLGFKKIIKVAFSLLFVFPCFSQSSITASQAGQKLSEIYGRFNSMPYISFDTRIVLQSDSLNGNRTYTEDKGKFSIAGNKCYQAVGDVEIMKTDSLVVAVYKSAKVMLLNKATVTDAGNIMQGSKALLDSITKSLASSYNMTSWTTGHGGTSIIRMHAVDTLQPYRKIEIAYSSLTKELFSVSYDVYSYANEDIETDNNMATSTMLRKQTITAFFENYRYDQNPNPAFSMDQYIHFDGRAYAPASSYAGYEFYDLVTVKEED